MGCFGVAFSPSPLAFVGAQPQPAARQRRGHVGKTEKAKRLSRHYVASKKSLSKDLSEKILQFVEEDWGILNSFQGLPDSAPVLSPPAVRGMGEKWLFGMLEKGVFRKQVSAVTKCSTTDIRAASEDHLIGDASLVGSLRNSRSLENFVNHSPDLLWIERRPTMRCTDGFGSSCGSLSRRRPHMCSEIGWSVDLLWKLRSRKMQCADGFGSSCGSRSRRLPHVCSEIIWSLGLLWRQHLRTMRCAIRFVSS